MTERGRARWAMAFAGLAIAIALGVAARSWLSVREPEGPLTRLTIGAPPGAAFDSRNRPALSADGRFLAFTATTADLPQLWIRPLEDSTARVLPGTDGATLPFWSPDGSALGFFAGGKLKIVMSAGGPPRVVADAPRPRGGSWSPRGVIVFAPDGAGPLYRVAASGGTAAPATRLGLSHSYQEVERSHRWPQFLPDGLHFLYMANGGVPDHDSVNFGSLESNEKVEVMSANSGAVYAPGHVIYVRKGALTARPFNLKGFRVTGEPIRLTEPVGQGPLYGWNPASVAAPAVLVHSMSDLPLNQLRWVDRAGRRLGTAGPPGMYAMLALSPDATQVAFEQYEAGTKRAGVALIDLGTGRLRTVGSDANERRFPLWSPDGRRLVFSAQNGPNAFDLHAVTAANLSLEEVVLQAAQIKGATDWTRDGQIILYQAFNTGTYLWDLWIQPLNGETQLLLQTTSNEYDGQLSPDGRWIAFASDVTGLPELYVRSFSGSETPRRISNGGGSQPRWRPDGQELFYINADSELVAVPLKPSPAGLDLGTEQVLFAADILRPEIEVIGGRVVTRGHQYSVTADGQRFLINAPVPANESIKLLINWPLALQAP